MPHLLVLQVVSALCTFIKHKSHFYKTKHIMSLPAIAGLSDHHLIFGISLYHF
jgi:hypothetical protein